jgi:hypothetical protein
MKKLLLLIIPFFYLQTVLAYQEKIVENNNQWGGKTIQSEFKENEQPPEVIIYAEINNFNQLGIKKIIEFYDFDSVLRKAVVFYKPTTNTELDFKKVTDYFNEKGDHIKSEHIFNSKFANKKGFYKKIAYYKKSGFNQEEFFYTQTQTKEQGYFKSILYKDFTGDVVKIDRFNIKNQLLQDTN